jgi:hypothetical protein
MQIDVAGRVKNTSLAASKPLLPLYEAVVNSIQAIEDVKERNGRIDIVVLRDSSHLFSQQEPELGEIIGFEVTDNGVGFNEENYCAFATSDTTYKADRGGKGIGRFVWLVAFDRIEVESHFEQDGKTCFRRFDFVPKEDGIRDMTIADSVQEKLTTTVRLVGFCARYQQQCPKKLDTIATHLIEHCLEYFIRSDCPEITLRDSVAENVLKLNELFEHEMAGKSERNRIMVEDHPLDVLHVRLHSLYGKDHQLYFCADSRVVKSEKLFGRLPDLARHLRDQDGSDFIYAAYVDGKILDDTVNAERTDFSIIEDDSELLTKTMTWRAIRNAVFKTCQNFLKPYTDPIREQKKERLENFVSTDGPMYRPILKYIEDKLEFIDPEINNDALDLRLYQEYHNLQVNLRVQGQQLLRKEVKDEEWEDFLHQLQSYFDKVSDINKSDLARYVCHRKAILEFFQKQLSLSDTGKYRLEERIHQIIFPLRKTSNEVFLEEHNLWVLDEKLVYHAFLASDKPLRTNPHVTTDSRKEPDIVVFDKACAFAPATDPPFPAIVIVEFKRPMRDDYTEDNNPVTQVLDYVRDIREGRAKTQNGLDIPIGKDIPFFCYVVANITPSLIKQIEYLDLTEMPDGQGFYGFRKQFNAYIEIVSYSKMITDAKKRNAAFFRTLGLPDRIT